MPFLTDRHFDLGSLRAETWRHTAAIATAHLITLQDIGLLDDDAAALLLAATDSIASSDAPDLALDEVPPDFDDRVDAQVPAGMASASRVGRATADVTATVVRCLLRDALLATGTALNRLRLSTIEFAAAHITTLMPAFVDRQPAQPTTLAHFLGGLIAPLGRAATGLTSAYDVVDRSPMGAGTFVSSGIGGDRERTAELLGFAGVLSNTFDAVSAVDHLVASAELAASLSLTINRFLSELQSLIRTDSGGLSLAESWQVVSDLPHLWRSPRLDAMVTAAVGIESNVTFLRRSTAAAPYGPITSLVGEVTNQAVQALTATIGLLDELGELLTTGLEVNRAYLANRAGKNLMTSADLADVLMLEEQIDPGSAQRITALVVAKLRAEGIETSGTTAEMIDAAALMVIGREIKVEFETISKYLAPRRFIERRSQTGGPAPAATRAYLDQERLRVGTGDRQLAARRNRLDTADAELHRRREIALEQVQLG